MGTDLSQMHGLTWDEWKRRLDAYHERLRAEEGIQGYGAGPLVEMTGEECWRGYFDDGYGPEDALDEDRTYWED